MRLIVTAPPSVNSLYLNVKKVGRVKAPAYRKWLDIAQWEAKQYKVQLFDKPVSVQVGVGKATQARDLDNYLKPVLDFLVKIGVLKDDNMLHVHKVTIAKQFEEVAAGFVRIEINEV